MSISNHQEGKVLYQFDETYEVNYVYFHKGSEWVNPSLILTLSRCNERNTFVFAFPHFNTVDGILMSAKGLFIVEKKQIFGSPSKIEVIDREKGFSYFTANTIKNITPFV